MRARVTSFLIAIVLWCILSYTVSVPYPHEVFIKFVELLIYPEPILGKTLVQHALSSILRVLVASLIAFSIAIPLGILCGWFKAIREVVVPIVEVLRPIPPIAWIPLAYIVFAPLPNTVYVSQLFIVFVGAFFPCFVSVFDYARNTPNELIEMAKVFNANDLAILRHIVIPYSVQGILTGIRIGLGVGWMCIIAAEMLATSGSGLGYFIMVMYEVGGRTTEIVCGIAMIGIIGYLMNYLLLKVERMIPWR